MSDIQFIPGPSVASVSREAAERGIQQHPAIRKGASYALEQVEGRWVAAIVRQAAPPFGAPADEEESAPGPKSEGPDDTAPSPDEEPPADDGESDGPPKEEKDKGKGGELHEVLDALHQIADALGVPLQSGDSMVPGPDDGGGPPGLGGPVPGLGGPPPPGVGGPAPDKMIHEKAMKPGETPPGGTPLGAPAFASVRADHPWAHIAGKVASFKASTPIGDRPMEDVLKETNALASEIGYRASVREDRDDDGNRVAVALITTH